MAVINMVNKGELLTIKEIKMFMKQELYCIDLQDMGNILSSLMLYAEKNEELEVFVDTVLEACTCGAGDVGLESHEE